MIELVSRVPQAVRLVLYGVTVSGASLLSYNSVVPTHMRVKPPALIAVVVIIPSFGGTLSYLMESLIQSNNNQSDVYRQESSHQDQSDVHYRSDQEALHIEDIESVQPVALVVDQPPEIDDLINLT